MEAYRYLLSKGYGPRHILLCGESAGGGLCYALCLKLKELGMEQPCGVIAISPWTDLTGSGSSYEANRDKDPSLTREVLDFYARCYAGEADKKSPLLSPLFGDLAGLPPSLLFAGGDEILLDDSRRLQEQLTACGCKSRLHIAPERWHAYVLYCLQENTFRTGVWSRPIMRSMPYTAPTMWDLLIISAPPTPTNMFLEWLDMPMTSWGTT